MIPNGAMHDVSSHSHHPFRFGVQAHVTAPQGDLKDLVDSKLGLGIGAHVTLDLAGGMHVLRPRLDYTMYPKANFFGVSNKVNSLGAGVDYLFFVDGKQQGVYFTAGLGVTRWDYEWNNGVGSVSDTSTKATYAVGMGFNFNQTFGAELRYNSSHIGNATANGIQVGATFRF